jgi:hypothetical protein
MVYMVYICYFQKSDDEINYFLVYFLFNWTPIYAMSRIWLYLHKEQVCLHKK